MNFNEPDVIANLKGQTVKVVLTTGDAITGTFKGANANGVRITPEGAKKETTRAFSKIADIHVLSEPADEGESIEDTRTERDYESEVAAFYTEDVLNADVEPEAENDEGEVMDDSQRETSSVVEETDLHVITLPTDAEMKAKAEAAYEAVKAEMNTRNEDEYDFEGDMTVITMDGGAYIEAEDVPDDVSAITDEGPALPGGVSTPAQLAEIFGVSAFQLRQALRALGLKVGKGKKYDLSTLTTKELTTIREKVMSK